MYSDGEAMVVVRVTEADPETDPHLMEAADLFVNDLIEKAQYELLDKTQDESATLLPAGTAAPRRRQRDADEGDDRGHHLRLIREEIHRRCRRFYQLFLSCYGQLP